MQCISDGSLVVIPHASNDLYIISGLIESQAFRTQSAFEGARKLPTRVRSMVPLVSHVSYDLRYAALKGGIPAHIGWLDQFCAAPRIYIHYRICVLHCSLHTCRNVVFITIPNQHSLIGLWWSPYLLNPSAVKVSFMQPFGESIMMALWILLSSLGNLFPLKTMNGLSFSPLANALITSRP